MRISVYLADGEQLWVSVEASDTVGKVISTLRRDSPGTQSFELRSRLDMDPLRDDQKLVDCGVKDGSRLFLVAQSRRPLQVASPRATSFGGHFEFNSFNHRVVLEFGKNLPKWRVVGPGISFISKCNDSSCAAYGDTVYVTKGMGDFDVARLSARIDCPECGHRARRSDNLGYYDCSVTFDGQTSDGKPIAFYDEADDGRFHTFKQGDNTQLDFLNVVVEEIHHAQQMLSR